MPASATDTAFGSALDLARTLVKSNPGTTAEQVIDCVERIYLALTSLNGPATAVEAPAPQSTEIVATQVVAAAPAEPKVSARDSISADGQYIYCMEDGAKLRMLKRYIKRFNLTPETYRARFNLPADYPMTAPGYSLQKRGEALAVGLGTHENKAGHNMHRELEAA